MSDAQFKQDLVAAIRPMRAFAISLAGKVDRADDLVQETLTKAWANRTSFTPGTNMRAWLFTILRNEFYSGLRKRGREVEDADGETANTVAVLPAQHGHMDLYGMRSALMKLPADQREALLLIAASDLSYEQAAEICGVAVGTVKSRVNRARAKLVEILDLREASGGGMKAARSVRS